ncbi:unnamed protein product [Urochloa decumbens]|uniref:DUF4220 domain-containing protein n=1 Tax=Urochloa decumbens TaxID=240449 RepID=A0ABC9B847_9POAL
MDFSEAVQWWEEWQLRVLVLTSLFIQYFLFLTAALRKHRIPAWFRFLIWLAYIGSDAVAIYALAILYNRQKKQEQVPLLTPSRSTDLQMLWTQILLLHLGGQSGITAYNIEDNELWRRHVLTAVSQWTLDREGLLDSLGWSLGRPFDESVLLWHLATDFCFHSMAMDSPPAAQEAARRSREMSNYMVYLLFVNPEMLMPGARRSLFRAAYNELEGMTPNENKPPLGEKEIAQNIIRMVKDKEGPSVVVQAWEIAQELMNNPVLQGEDKGKMWRVIQGVWVEMLCFSAGRCRGYLHAKSLGKGGEYLSYVWLLLSYMGMETLAEKMQRTELQEGIHEGGIGTRNRWASGATSSDNIV